MAGEQLDAILEGMMNNSYKADEKISAFADGELDVSLHDAVLNALREPEASGIWENYHCIGDVLRSSEAMVAPGAEFASRMATRLADEPIHLKSEECPVVQSVPLTAPCDRPYGVVRRLAVPGAAIAATVILALSASLNNVNDSEISIATDTASPIATPVAATASAIHDAQIGDYLLAHQRFSPSLYTTAHYARFSNSAKE